MNMKIAFLVLSTALVNLTATSAECSSFNGVYEKQNKTMRGCANALIISRYYQNDEGSMSLSEDQTVIATVDNLETIGSDFLGRVFQSDYGAFRNVTSESVYFNIGKCKSHSDAKLGLGITTEWSESCITKDDGSELQAIVKRHLRILKTNMITLSVT